MTVTLYRLEGCPFCEFAVDKLDEVGVEYESVFVEGLHSLRDEVKRVSGQRQVPLLVDEDRGVTMHETSRIFEYLQATYGDADDVDADAAVPGPGGDE